MINALPSIAIPAPSIGGPAPQTSAAEKAVHIGQEFANVLKEGENAAIAGMTGEMPLQESINKVLEAERSFHTAMALRDKIVGAYLELSRMQI